MGTTIHPMPARAERRIPLVHPRERARQAQAQSEKTVLDKAAGAAISNVRRHIPRANE